MRIGKNQSKDQFISKKDCSHRVIIPLYIPNEDGYYKDAFKIFEMCLFSVIKTSVSPLKISVISNGSCSSINKQLVNLQQENYIDELIIETETIGKINSILKALRTADERLITITDADVLFLNNWEESVINVFKAFPKVGVVCPVPVFRTHLQLTSNIWLRYLFSKKLKFRAVKSPIAMTKFAYSIGWPWLDDKWKDIIGTLKANNGTIAVLGSSHFVGTYKREVFNQLPKENSIYKLGGDSEFLYTDQLVLKMGGYRLSTYDNYAYHLGNVLEDWMTTVYNNIKEVGKTEEKHNFKMLKKPFINYSLFEKFFNFLISIDWLKKRIFKMKGLTNQQIKNFIK